jgi:hypothetical protein
MELKYILGLLATYKLPFNFGIISKKVKLSLWQTVEAHRVVRRRGSHIF